MNVSWIVIHVCIHSINLSFFQTNVEIQPYGGMFERLCAMYVRFV